MRSVQVNGLSIAYERVGEGPPLVLAHGAGDGSRIWHPQLDALADEYTVVAWDEPGAGRSSDLPEGFGLRDYAACLAGLVEALDLGPVHLAGLSWGGVVALQTYADHPRVVGTLILADTYAGWKGSLPEEEIRARNAGVRRMLAPSSSQDAVTLPGLFAGDPPPEFAPLLAELAADVRPDTLARQLTMVSEADLSSLLPRISVPTLLIWGADDVRSPVAVAHQFERGIAESRLVLLPDCGHLSNLQQPVMFNDAVRDFCLAHPLGS